MSTSHPIENFDSQMQFLLLAYFQKKITVSPNETTESAWVDFLNYITDNFKCDSPLLAYNLSNFKDNLDEFVGMVDKTSYQLAKEYVEAMNLPIDIIYIDINKLAFDMFATKEQFSFNGKQYFID